MKSTLTHVFLSAFLGVCTLGTAQVPSSYLFFSQSDLQGMDLNQCYQTILNKARDHKLSTQEVYGYMYHQEKAYVERNLGTPLRVKSIIVPAILTSPCSNSDFETGTFTGWTGGIGYNTASSSPLTIATVGISTLGANAPETGCSYHTLVNTATDPYSGLPMVDPGGGTWAVRLGGENLNINNVGGVCTPADPNMSDAYSSGETLQHSFPITSSSYLISYSYSVVLDAAPHLVGEMPYFRIEVLDSANNPIPGAQYFIESTHGTLPPGFVASPHMNVYTGDTVFYCPWTTNNINLKAYIGHTVTLRFTASGCIYGGHAGYAYVDAVCGTIPQITATPAVCTGGTVTLTAPATTGTYAWNTMPSGTAGIVGSTTGQSVTLNANGTYQVTITPIAGAAYAIDTTITFYPNPSVTSVAINTSCASGSDGQITATPTGGNTPYSYSWFPAPGGGQGTAIATGLSAGTYTVAVTTMNGCTSSSVASVTSPAGITASATSTPATCGSGDGTATVSATGGTSPFTYSWSSTPTQTTSVATILLAGSYTVQITDSKGCAQHASVTVANTNAPALTMSSNGVSCNGANDGTAMVTATGGIAPYTYSWNTTPVVVAANEPSLAAGNYTVQVTDHGGCISYATVSITQPSVLNVTLAGVNPSCSGCTDGSATATVSGGTTAYTYSWSPAPGGGQGTANVTGLGAGTYTCTVTDNNNCTANSSTSLSVITGIASYSNPDSYIIYPNPAGNSLVVEFSVVQAGICVVTVCNMLGQQVLAFTQEVSGTLKRNVDITALPEGIYLISLESVHGKQIRKLIVKK